MSIFQNERFNELRKKLEAEGVILRPMWEAESNRRQRDGTDIWCFAVIGAPDGGYRGTVVVIDYGKNGFGLYYEAETAAIDDDVAKIMGGRPIKELIQ